MLTESTVRILSPTEIAGSTSVTGGWNKQPNSYTVYFYARLSTPAASWGTWLNDQLTPGSKSAHAEAGSSSGAWLTFAHAGDHPVLMKIGISFVSIAQARQNLAAEIPGFDFDAVHAAALAKWDKALGTVELKGETPEQAQIFYTALYHTMLMPTDRTGENPLWKSSEPYYDDYYAIWDIFRTSSPLLLLIAPEREAEIVRALVDLYRHEGWLPDARSGNYNGRTQGGSNAEFVLTDAFVKGMKGVDWKTALAAEMHDAEVSPADHFKEGRGGLDDWHHLGYVSIEGSDRPASADMEYAADDFEIALLAKGLGDTADYEKYLQRSANWKKLWDPDFSEGGFTGFIRPRHRDGTWLTPFTAMMSCSWNGDTFYEGNSWTYSTFVPQDVASLIEKSGGPETFVRRLDAFFDVPGRYDVGNEPGFLAPYLYIWAGRPDKTDARVRQIIAASYHAGPDGLPGNDDSGAMSSWYRLRADGHLPQRRPGCLPHRQPRLSPDHAASCRRQGLRDRSQKSFRREHLRHLGDAERPTPRPRLASSPRDRRRRPAGAHHGQRAQPLGRAQSAPFHPGSVVSRMSMAFTEGAGATEGAGGFSPLNTGLKNGPLGPGFTADGKCRREARSVRARL